jgi:beta-phosphoglucomutase-like phosphatase (HAD superfamily)
MNALIFDCDGVLIDSEGTLHLQAFNRVWEEEGIPWRWSIDEYRRLTKISGGKERLRTLYDNPRFRRAMTVPPTLGGWNELVARWHNRKTEIYIENLTKITHLVRPGIRRLTGEALSARWQVAVASSGATASVSAVVRLAFGDTLARTIPIITGEMVAQKKPHPEVYLTAAQVLKVPATQCVVIEDTVPGVQAAAAAKMPCIVTPTSDSAANDYPGAALVVTSLGDPAGPLACELSSPPRLARPWVTIDDVAKLLHCHACATQISL